MFFFIFSRASAAQADLQSRLERLAGTTEGTVSVTFIDLQTGRKASVRGDLPMPAASVAKVPVMCAAFHLADLGQLDLQKKILFRNSDKLEGAGVLRWMKGGREYSLWNLMRLMITLSDNSATRLVVNFVSLPTIEAYTQDLGLTRTRIVDPTMLVEPPAENNNLTSADDMARLLEMIYNHRGFSQRSAKQMIAWMNYQRYRWGIWRGVPPGTYVADKTGHLDGILNDVGLVYTQKGTYALAVFTAGFKNKSHARQLINELSRVTYEEYTGEKVVRAKTTKRRLSRRPSVKSKRRSGRSGQVSSRKSRTSPRR